jgi:hypothetical protein
VGPLPPWCIECTVVFADGLRVPVVVAADAAGPIEVSRPRTATLRVRLLRDGAPVRKQAVRVATFAGKGPAPGDDEAFERDVVWHHGVTGEDGIATMVVRTGEIMVAVWGSSARHRVRVEGALAAGELRGVDVVLPVQ